MRSKIFYTLLGLAVGIILSWDILFMSTIEMGKAGVTLWTGFAMGLFVLLLEIIPMTIMLTTYLDHRKRAVANAVISWKPVKDKVIYTAIGLALGIISSVNFVWARSIDLSQAGVAFWVFVGVGIIIVLLQLIPAIIMFLAFIGTATKMVHEKVMVKKEDEEVVPAEKEEVKQT